MGRYTKPNIPFVEASHKGKRQRPTLIVLESSFTTSSEGAALAIANHMHSKFTTQSVHYVVDEAKIFRCVDDRISSLHSVDVKNSICVRICDDPSAPIGRWDSKSHQDLLSHTADLVAQLCLLYGISPRLLTYPEWQKWQKWRNKRRGGVLVQGFMAQAYWPSDYFMTLVEAHMTKYKFIRTK